mgnify:CR=1 FL=1
MKPFFEKISSLATSVHRKSNQPSVALQAYQLMRQLSAVAISIGLAKSSLSLGQIGAWEQLLFIGTTCTFFWVTGLLHGMLPIYPNLPENQRKSLIFNVFVVFNGLATGLFLLLFFGKNWIVPALTGRPELEHFDLFVLWLCIGLPSYPVEHYFLLKEKGCAIFWWGIFGFGGQICCAVLPIWLGFGLHGALIALISLSAARWFFSAYLTVRWGKLFLDKSLIISYLQISWPIMANQIAGSFVLFFDAWLVGHYFHDEAAFAVFRYGAREFPLALALSTGLATAMVPRLAADFSTGLDELRSRDRKLMHLVFPAVIGLLLLSKWLFPLVFNPNFGASVPIFNLFLLISASRLVMTYPAMLALGEVRAVFWVTILEILVKIALGFWLIKIGGLPGLALANVLAFWVEKIGQMLFLWKKHGVLPGQILDLRLFLGYSAAMLAAWAVSCL